MMLSLHLLPTPCTGEQEDPHGRLASLPALIKDQWALGILSVIKAAAHGKKGREKAYARIILRHVDAGHTPGASRLKVGKFTCNPNCEVSYGSQTVDAVSARSLADMWRCGMHQACTDIIQCVALEYTRPDAAAAVVVELTGSQNAADVAADLLASLVRTDRTLAAVEMLKSLLAAHHYFAAARVCVQMVRCAEALSLHGAYWAVWGGALLWYT